MNKTMFVYSGLLAFSLAACSPRAEPEPITVSDDVVAVEDHAEFQPDFSPREQARYYPISDEDKARLVPGEFALPALKRGYDIYQLRCAVCHSYGYEKGGTLQLHDRYQGEVPAMIALREDMDRGFIETFVRTPTRGMPPFRITEITEDDMDDLVAYLTRLNPSEEE